MVEESRLDQALVNLFTTRMKLVVITHKCRTAVGVRADDAHGFELFLI